MSPTMKQTLIIAGLQVHVYAHSAAARSSRPVVIFFFLHGRLGSANESEPIVETMVELSHGDAHERDLFVVTFDQRNHGARLADSQANYIWSKNKEENNDRHAIDMYSIQTGTAKDVSFLIDFLPAYLFPSNERTICEWGVAGVSLGGHSTWIILANDPRVKTGIPIIGCPDYLALISQRAMRSDIPMAPPYFPSNFVSLVQEIDPASTQYRALDGSNPFLKKKVLVLSGKEDTLVPWSASKVFVEGLEVGKEGVKKVIVQDGAGHECTKEMEHAMVLFLRDQVLGGMKSRM